MKKVTMKDVARFANVAIGTVDRVLNNTGYASPEKIKAVVNAVEELGYVPNRAASVLSKQQTINIGVVYPNEEVYFWAQINKGIQLAEKHYGPYGLSITREYFKTYNPDDQLAFLERFLKSNTLHGLAFIPLHPTVFNPIIDRLHQDGVPVVTFDSDAPASKRICFVGEDAIKGGKLAGRLVALLLGGKGRVAVLRGQPNFLCIQQRVLGFTEKMSTEFPEIEIVNFYDMYEKINDINYQDSVLAILDDIEKTDPPVDCVFVTNALVNFVGKAMCRRERLKNVKLVGFDYTEETGKLILDDVISAVVAEDLEEEGYMAIKILCNYLMENRLPASKYHVTDFSIKIKETISD